MDDRLRWRQRVPLLKDLVVHRHVRIDFVEEVWVKLEFELLVFVLIAVWIMIWVTAGARANSYVGSMLCCVNNVAGSELLFILVALLLNHIMSDTNRCT